MYVTYCNIWGQHLPTALINLHFSFLFLSLGAFVRRSVDRSHSRTNWLEKVIEQHPSRKTSIDQGPLNLVKIHSKVEKEKLLFSLEDSALASGG